MKIGDKIKVCLSNSYGVVSWVPTSPRFHSISCDFYFGLDERSQEIVAPKINVNPANVVQVDEAEFESVRTGPAFKHLSTDFLRSSVDDLDLSVRAANCLNGRVRCVGDLVQKSEVEVLKIKNLGRKTLKEIEIVLAEVGLVLGIQLPSATK